jgi:hypothetical protein
LSLLLFFSVTYLRALPKFSPETEKWTTSIQELAEKPVLPARKPSPALQTSPPKAISLPLLEKRSFQAIPDTVPVQSSVKISSGSTNVNIIGDGHTVTVNPDGMVSSGPGKPLLIIDGKNLGRLPHNKQEDPLNKLDPNKIASIDVLKGESATKIYGEEGKDGVLVIRTKGYKGGDEPVRDIVNFNKVEISIAGENEENGEINTRTNLNITSRGKMNTSGMEGRPLIIKDGKVLGRLHKGESGSPLKGIDPNTIKSISIHKGQSAIDKYGKDAEDGAIEITTKQQ